MIEHFSDAHGFLPKFSGDVLICSGDLMPNGPGRACRDQGKVYQANWLETVGEAFRGKQLIYCAGNHDFIDPCPILKGFGCDAINITNRGEEINGVKYFPLDSFLDFLEENGLLVSEEGKEWLKENPEVHFDSYYSSISCYEDDDDDE